MQVIRSSPIVPGISIIDLDQPFGHLRGSLTRHWYNTYQNHEGGGVWYEFVLRCADGAIAAVMPVSRIIAAQLCAADRTAGEG